MEQKNFLNRTLSMIQRQRRHRRWMQAVTGMAAAVVFITTYLLILPAITMEHGTIQVSSGRSEAELNETALFEIKATAADDREETVFVLNAHGDNAGLDESQIIFKEETAQIRDEDGQTIELHREYAEEGTIAYWFTLAKGQSGSFRLPWINGVKTAADLEGNPAAAGKLTLSFGSGETLEDALENAVSNSEPLTFSWKQAAQDSGRQGEAGRNGMNQPESDSGEADQAAPEQPETEQQPDALQANEDIPEDGSADSPEPQAAPEEGTAFSDAQNCTYTVTVETSEDSYEQGESGTVNTSNFSVILDVTFTTGWAEVNGGQQVYYYKVPEGLALLTETGDLTDDSGRNFGTYEFTEDGYIVIRLSEEAVQNYYSVKLQVTGTAQADVTEDTVYEFENGPSITVTTDNENEDLAAHTKNVTVQESEDGSITYNYKIGITAKEEDLTDLYIEDSYTCTGLSVNDLTLNENYKVTLTGAEGTSDTGTGRFYAGELADVPENMNVSLSDSASGTVSFKGSVTSASNTAGLHYYLTRLPAGSTLTVEYSVTVDAEVRKKVDAGSGSYALSNTAEFTCGEDISLGSSSTYTPYRRSERWMTKTSGAEDPGGDGAQRVPWILEAGSSAYTLNGLFLTDTIARAAYDEGVEYVTDNGTARVVIRNETTQAAETVELTWVEVDSLESLTDEQKADRTKIYWHENSFAWYSGTAENNENPYTYTLTYYTTYVEEIFQKTDQINGAYAHYKGYVSGVDPGVSDLAEVSLTKALQEISEDGTVSYASEIYTNGKFTADHFLLYDYLPMTSTGQGDRLLGLDRLIEYVETDGAAELDGSVEQFKQLVRQGETCFRSGEMYLLLFDSAAEFEDTSGITVSVTGDDGASLDEEAMLAGDGKKILFAFNPEPVADSSSIACYFGIQFNVDIEAISEEDMVSGLPGTAQLIEYSQGYTIRMEYETTAHQWGNTAYAGQTFINQQQMLFRVPDISSVDQSQYASAYYFFDAVADSTILNKYISGITESADGKVTLNYSIDYDLEKINIGSEGLWLFDGVSTLEGVDLSSVETAEDFLVNAKIIFSNDEGETYVATAEDLNTWATLGGIFFYNRDQLVNDYPEYAELLEPYEPVYAMTFSKSLTEYIQANGFNKVTIAYPAAVDKNEINLTEGDYSLRNLARLYTANDASDIQAVSESWTDYGYTADVLGKFQTQRPTAGNEHTARWQIIVNTDKLVPEDSTSFTVRDTLDGSQIVDPSSIHVYGVRGGTNTELTGGVEMTYDQNQNTLVVTISDNVNGEWNYPAYLIEYETILRGGPGSTVEYSNTAEIVGMNESGKTVTDKVYIEESSGMASGESAAITVYKYDSNDITSRLAGAKFTLSALVEPIYSGGMTQEDFLAANQNNWTRIAEGTTGDTGTITWTYSNSGNDDPLRYLTPGMLFRLEETEAPEGYAEAAPIYGYIPDGNTVSGGLTLFEAFPTNHENNCYTGVVFVSDTKLTALEVRKVDDSENPAPLEGAAFGLYRDEACTDLVRQGMEIGGGVHEFGNLEPGTYYLKEIYAPEGYNRLEIVLKVEVRADGTITADAGSNTDCTIGQDSGGWYIQVVNHVGFALPETGGPGITLFTAGGIALMAVACLMYRNLRRKDGEGAS